MKLLKKNLQLLLLQKAITLLSFGITLHIHALAPNVTFIGRNLNVTDVISLDSVYISSSIGSVQFLASDANKISVSGKNLIAKAEGVVTITAFQQSDNSFDAITVTSVFNVIKALSIINISPSASFVGFNVTNFITLTLSGKYLEGNSIDIICSNNEYYNYDGLVIDTITYNVYWFRSKNKITLRYTGGKLPNTIIRIGIPDLLGSRIEEQRIKYFKGYVTISGQNFADKLIYIDGNFIYDVSGATKDELQSQKLNIFPNPISNKQFLYFEKSISGEITDLHGTIFLHFKNKYKIQIDNIPNGIYFLNTNFGKSKLAIQE